MLNKVFKEDPKKNKLFFVLFVVVWGALCIWNYISPTQTFSEAENRNLAQFPEYNTQDLLDGDFMNGVDTWLNDQFAGRGYWVSAQSLLEYGIGKREINNIYIGDGALLSDLDEPTGNNTTNNIEGINAFAELYDMPTYVMLVPSSTTIQSDKLPTFAEGWDEVAYIQDANAQFNSNVTVVDVTGTLAEHNSEYIFYRTDHHWTTYGAYLAYTELREAMGLPALTIEDFNVQTVSDNFLGTYHSKTGYPLVQADSIDLYARGQATGFTVNTGLETLQYDDIYFNEFLVKKDQYSYFLGQVQPYVTIYTTSTTGKKLIVFKDSYAHCLTPMMLEDYSEIQLVDMRYLNDTNFEAYLHISEYDEALFVYSTDVFSHQMGAGKFLLA